MKSIDALLIGTVFVVWALLTLMYATIPMIYMPPAIRVWGLGGLLFFLLALLVMLAEHKGRSRNSS
jgi:hypothetical protein